MLKTQAMAITDYLPISFAGAQARPLSVLKVLPGVFPSCNQNFSHNQVSSEVKYHELLMMTYQIS